MEWNFLARGRTSCCRRSLSMSERAGFFLVAVAITALSLTTAWSQ